MLSSIAQVHSYQNVEWRLTDKDGKPKKLFQDNRLFTYLMKKGIVSPFFPKIPFLLGRWSDKKVVRNLVTNAGFALNAGLLCGSGSPAAVTYIALGTGTTAAAVTDTALQTEIATGGLARASATVSLITTSVANDTAQLFHTFSATASFALTESGILNAAASGTLFAHQVFSVVNVNNGDNLQITWKIQEH
ncbi:hypothetical protein M1295_01465 [Patescibacteria group bacterium]|nr:hypothetical protein [Patescibacteria group bacterium]